MAPTSFLLSSYAKRGERLLADAAAIGDGESFRFWKTRKSGWMADTVGALRGEVDGETLGAFQVAVRPVTGEGSIHEDLPVELEGLREGLGVLLGLADQLARRA